MRQGDQRLNLCNYARNLRKRNEGGRRKSETLQYLEMKQGKSFKELNQFNCLLHLAMRRSLVTLTKAVLRTKA